MACSGSGKSTLLDIISSRKTMGKITGQVLFGSQKATQPFLRRYAGYVEQADTLLPVLVRSICSPVLMLQLFCCQAGAAAAVVSCCYCE